MKVNSNYQKLPGSYLFSEIARRVAAYSAAHPDAKLIKLGIGEASLTDEAAEAAESAAPTPEAAPAPAPDPAPLIIERYGLTPRESDVLPLLLEGRTIQRIQETLFISAGTVSTHIRHIYQKTGADNRQELIDLSHRIVEGNQESVDGADQAK